MRTIEQRFLDKVLIPEDKRACWEWQAGKHKGYGRIGINGKNVLAHRLSYLMFNGYLHKTSVVRHKCDNTGCVNPNHLLLGTQADNNRDTSERSRHVAWNTKKTHCKHGHEFTDANTHITALGKRHCRKCDAFRHASQ